MRLSRRQEESEGCETGACRGGVGAGGAGGVGGVTRRGWRGEDKVEMDGLLATGISVTVGRRGQNECESVLFCVCVRIRICDM